MDLIIAMHASLAQAGTYRAVYNTISSVSSGLGRQGEWGECECICVPEI